MEKSSALYAVLLMKDATEVYSRLFNHHPVIGGEIKYFLKEFEEQRRDREIEKLFKTLENTTEIRDSLVDKARNAADVYLPSLSTDFDAALTVCHRILQKSDTSKEDEDTILEEQRQARATEWDTFMKDIAEKRSKVDESFLERETQFVNYYRELEEKMWAMGNLPSS